MAVLLAVGCGGSSGSPTSSSGGGQAPAVIGNSVPQGADPTLAIQSKALEDEAKRLGMSVLSADANLDLNKQIADVDALIQKPVGALVVWPMDSQGIQPALGRAQKADIPVITRQTKIGGPYFVNLQADDVAAGRQAALYLGRRLGRGAKVAAIIGPQQVESFRDLATGFRQGAEQAGLDVLDTQTNRELNAESSATFTRDWKQRFGKSLQGIFDSLDTPALGTVSVRDASFDPIVVTYGGSDAALQAVRDGKLTAIMYQEPVLTGRAEAWAANRAVKGQKLPTTVYVPEPLVDRSNIADFPPSDQQLAKPVTFSVRRVSGKALLQSR